MSDPWHYCEGCARFYPPTEPLCFTQCDGEVIALCERCYKRL